MSRSQTDTHAEITAIDFVIVETHNNKLYSNKHRDFTAKVSLSLSFSLNQIEQHAWHDAVASMLLGVCVRVCVTCELVYIESWENYRWAIARQKPHKRNVLCEEAVCVE